MSSSHIASKGKKSAASSSAANKQSQSNGTQVCTVDYSSLDCDALEDVLKRCVQRGKDTSTGSNGIHHNAVDEMLKTARKGVDQEEKNFEFAQNISMEHERDRSSKGKRTESVVIERENDSADMVGRGLMAAMDQQSLGSAGSSKASSNASDESEEMDISGGSHPGSGRFRMSSNPTRALLMLGWIKCWHAVLHQPAASCNGGVIRRRYPLRLLLACMFSNICDRKL